MPKFVTEKWYPNLVLFLEIGGRAAPQTPLQTGGVPPPDPLQYRAIEHVPRGPSSLSIVYIKPLQIIYLSYVCASPKYTILSTTLVSPMGDFHAASPDSTY